MASQAAEPGRTELPRVLLEGRIGRDPRRPCKPSRTAWRAGTSTRSSPPSTSTASRWRPRRRARNVADTVRERQRLDGPVHTLTAEGRLSAYVLTGLPILLALFFKLTNPITSIRWQRHPAHAAQRRRRADGHWLDVDAQTREVSDVGDSMNILVILSAFAVCSSFIVLWWAVSASPAVSRRSATRTHRPANHCPAALVDRAHDEATGRRVGAALRKSPPAAESRLCPSGSRLRDRPGRPWSG